MVDKAESKIQDVIDFLNDLISCMDGTIYVPDPSYISESMIQIASILIRDSIDKETFMGMVEDIWDETPTQVTTPIQSPVDGNN